MKKLLLFFSFAAGYHTAVLCSNFPIVNLSGGFPSSTLPDKLPALAEDLYRDADDYIQLSDDAWGKLVANCKSSDGNLSIGRMKIFFNEYIQLAIENEYNLLNSQKKTAPQNLKSVQLATFLFETKVGQVIAAVATVILLSGFGYGVICAYRARFGQSPDKKNS